MRMIDMFRTPSQQKIILWLEDNHMGTMIEIARGVGLYPTGRGYYRHFHTLIKDDVIHICGYVGDKNIPVYALCSRIGDPTGSPSIASKYACFRRCP